MVIYKQVLKEIQRKSAEFSMNFSTIIVIYGHY